MLLCHMPYAVISMNIVYDIYIYLYREENANAMCSACKTAYWVIQLKYAALLPQRERERHTHFRIHIHTSAFTFICLACCIHTLCHTPSILYRLPTNANYFQLFSYNLPSERLHMAWLFSFHLPISLSLSLFPFPYLLPSLPSLPVIHLVYYCFSFSLSIFYYAPFEHVHKFPLLVSLSFDNFVGGIGAGRA